tara:strand:+ start:274 stop:522 length:249 start_codon:yes stop_codon:yes gene_type:complete
MAQFTFTCIDEENCTTTVEFEGIFLPHVIDRVEGFLKASGFFFEELNYTKCEEINFEDEIKVGLTSSTEPEKNDDVQGDPSF